jgi:ketosteroid isomerase-like protein
MESTMRNAVILMIAVLCGCAVSGTQSAESVREVIDRNNASAVRWYAAGDVDSLASMFAVDAWQMPPNNPPLVGREAIRGFWREAVKWGKWEFILQSQDVSVSGQMAVERGKYSLKFTAGPGAPPGMASFQDRGNYLVHWRHESDGQGRAVGDAPVSEMPR